jgi:hypothetical protein
MYQKGNVCSMHGRYEKYIEGFVREKNRRKETTWENLTVNDGIALERILKKKPGTELIGIRTGSSITLL